MWVRIKLKVKSLDSGAVVDVNSLGILSLASEGSGRKDL